MYSTRGPSRHPIPRLPAGENRVQIVQGPESHGVAGLAGGAADMQQQECVVQLPVTRVDVRLAVEDVQTGRRHLARAQGLLQGLVVDEGAARALLTTNRPRTQQPDALGVQEVPGRRRRRAMQGQHVTGGQQSLQTLMVDRPLLDLGGHTSAIVVVNAHPEAAGTAGRHLAHAAHADDP